MILGMRTLTFSASFFEDDEEEEPSKFEKWLDNHFGEALEKVLMPIVMVFSVIAAIAIFMVLPLGINSLIRPLVPSDTVMAFLEGSSGWPFSSAISRLSPIWRISAARLCITGRSTSVLTASNTGWS